MTLSTTAMADKTPEPTAQPVAPIPRTTRPMSEALLNEKVRHTRQQSSQRSSDASLESHEHYVPVDSFPGINGRLM